MSYKPEEGLQEGHKGLRFNKGKTRHHLIPPFAQEQYAKVLSNSAVPVGKYPERNWENGMPWSPIFSSLMRHLLAWQRGEDLDPESGLFHMAHVMCNSAFLLEYYRIYPQGDDRQHAYLRPIRLGLDIDGVIADWVTHWCRHHNIPIPTSWYFDRFIQDKFNELKDNEEFWMSIPLMCQPGELPYEPVVYITQRIIPVEWTIKYLDRAGFPAAPVESLGWNQSKLAMAQQYKLDFFVDDRFETFVELNNAGICCFLMDAAYNQRYKVGHKRIYKLSDLGRIAGHQILDAHEAEGQKIASILADAANRSADSLQQLSAVLSGSARPQEEANAIYEAGVQLAGAAAGTKLRENVDLAGLMSQSSLDQTPEPAQTLEEPTLDMSLRSGLIPQHAYQLLTTIKRAGHIPEIRERYAYALQQYIQGHLTRWDKGLPPRRQPILDLLKKVQEAHKNIKLQTQPYKAYKEEHPHLSLEVYKYGLKIFVRMLMQTADLMNAQYQSRVFGALDTAKIQIRKHKIFSATAPYVWVMASLESPDLPFIVKAPFLCSSESSLYENARRILLHIAQRLAETMGHPDVNLHAPGLYGPLLTERSIQGLVNRLQPTLIDVIYGGPDDGIVRKLPCDGPHTSKDIWTLAGVIEDIGDSPDQEKSNAELGRMEPSVFSREVDALNAEVVIQQEAYTSNHIHMASRSEAVSANTSFICALYNPDLPSRERARLYSAFKGFRDANVGWLGRQASLNVQEGK